VREYGEDIRAVSSGENNGGRDLSTDGMIRSGRGAEG
jgi:hypothetical protein